MSDLRAPLHHGLVSDVENCLHCAELTNGYGEHCACPQSPGRTTTPSPNSGLVWIGTATPIVIADRETIELGRTSGNPQVEKLCKPYGDVSGKHAKITLNGRYVMVEDTNSCNGTFVPAAGSDRNNPTAWRRLAHSESFALPAVIRLAGRCTVRILSAADVRS